MLKGNTAYLQTFKDNWKNANKNGNVSPVFDNPNVVYSNADFDQDILDANDKTVMSLWLMDLTYKISNDPIAVFKDIASRKKNPYKKINDEERKYFNRCSWLSLGKKGEILVESFKTQFFPKIKRVLSTQQYAHLKDDSTGDSIVGVIDMVLEIEGYDKPIIFDLKTAAQPYRQEQIELTEQLTLYSAMEAKKYNTDLVGYVVLCKNINKERESICTKCNKISAGRHKTCNEDVGGKRCHGTFAETLVIKPEVQVLVQSKSQDQMNGLLRDYGNIIHAMKENVVFKNTDKCNNWYGGKCAYYNLCHGNGDMTGLKKKG